MAEAEEDIRPSLAAIEQVMQEIADLYGRYPTLRAMREQALAAKPGVGVGEVDKAVSQLDPGYRDPGYTERDADHYVREKRFLLGGDWEQHDPWRQQRYGLPLPDEFVSQAMGGLPNPYRFTTIPNTSGNSSSGGGGRSGSGSPYYTFTIGNSPVPVAFPPGWTPTSTQLPADANDDDEHPAVPGWERWDYANLRDLRSARARQENVDFALCQWLMTQEGNLAAFGSDEAWWDLYQYCRHACPRFDRSEPASLRGPKKQSDEEEKWVVMPPDEEEKKEGEC